MIYHDDHGYGCRACGRRWTAEPVHHRWPVRLKLTRRWSWPQRHWFQTGWWDYSKRCFATVYHFGFLRIVVGEHPYLTHSRPISGCVHCSVELAALL